VVASGATGGHRLRWLEVVEFAALQRFLNATCRY